MKELRNKIKKMIGSKNICENAKQSSSRREVDFIFILIIILLFCSISAHAQDEQTKNILVLNSYHKGFLWTDNLVSGLISVLDIEENNIELIIEYMDTKTQGYSIEYKRILYEFYKYKYQDHKFDLIISSDDNAFNFLREFHDELFPGVPVVFSGVNNIDAPNLVDPNEFTGILETIPFKKTIDLMLELHPKTKKIIIVVDKTPSGEYRWDITESILGQYEDIEFIRLSDDYYSSEIEDMVGGLGEDTLVLFFSLYRDKSGRYLSLKEGALLVSEASTRPVYITHQQVFPYGVVGGDLLGGFYHGEKVAKIAKRVLAGEEMSGIPTIRKSPTQFMFDYVQLEKWGIKLSDLPEHSVIVNKPFSFYNEYKYFVFGIIVIVIFLVAIIIVLQANILRRKQAENELINAKEKAEESDRLKSAFLANMSHEIRTPMNGLLGFIHLLNEPNLSKAQIEQYTAIINKSSDRLLNTINDIIDISKIEAGEMTVSYTETSINDVMEELYSFFLPEAKQKGLSLTVESSLSTEHVMVVTDSHKFYGILSNLIKNAIKYTEKGSIEFGYALKNNSEPPEVELFVRDTGVGIPKDRIKAVFNRFEQADTGYLRVFEGSGLGLAISKAYAEMLGGEISLTSDEGKGSIFSFTIPYTKKIRLQSL